MELNLLAIEVTVEEDFPYIISHFSFFIETEGCWQGRQPSGLLPEMENEK